MSEIEQFEEVQLHSNSSLDKQEGGNHYKQFKIQPIEFTHKNGLNFCEGNVIKYVSRHRHKNGVEDLKKAIHYIELLIDLEYGEKENDRNQETSKGNENGL